LEKLNMAFATDRDTAFCQGTNDLGQAGVFNDAVRLSNCGPWAQQADNNNQQYCASQSEADGGTLRSDIASAIANDATVDGTSVTPSPNTLTEIQGQHDPLAAAAPSAVGQNSLGANGIMNAAFEGFQTLPTQATDEPSSVAAAEAGLNLSDTGTVFNAATSLTDGELNGSNLSHFGTAMHAVADVPKNAINDGGIAAARGNTAAEQALAKADGITLSAPRALTGIHAQTMPNHVELQIGKLDGMSAPDPNIDPPSTNDYLLDIVDSAQNDPVLAASAGIATGESGLTRGFEEFPGYIMGTIQHYQSNQAQLTVLGLPIHLRFRDMKIGDRTMKSLTITWLR
jgi:hypothetical protein